MEMPKTDYKKALRRIDLRLLPYTILLYFCSQVDKHNLGQAHARDLDEDLHLKDNQYAILLSLYFPAYLILHYVSGIFLRHLRPRRYIPATILLCGITTLCLCRANSFADMAVGRLLLGMFEGSLSPCITILYASWYPIEQIATRLMTLHLASPIAGVVGAFVCAAFYLLEGAQGMQGWQWMFLVEGLFTLLLAVPGFWILPNFIEQDGERLAVEKGKSKGRSAKECVTDLLRSVATPCSVLKQEQRTQWVRHLQRQSGPLRRVTPFTWGQVFRPFAQIHFCAFHQKRLTCQEGLLTLMSLQICTRSLARRVKWPAAT